MYSSRNPIISRRNNSIKAKEKKSIIFDHTYFSRADSKGAKEMRGTELYRRCLYIYQHQACAPTSPTLNIQSLSFLSVSLPRARISPEDSSGVPQVRLAYNSSDCPRARSVEVLSDGPGLSAGIFDPRDLRALIHPNTCSLSLLD